MYPLPLLCVALLLQFHDKVSDAEARRRSILDISWKVALGVGMDDKPFAKSTLHRFRAQLVLHDKLRDLFVGSLALAAEEGLLPHAVRHLVLDTTPILGRGAVKDTWNLLADGIVELLRRLARLAGEEVADWAAREGYGRYLAPSIKGTEEVDWGDSQACKDFLAPLVADADRLLAQARAVCAAQDEAGQVLARGGVCPAVPAAAAGCLPRGWRGVDQGRGEQGPGRLGV